MPPIIAAAVFAAGILWLFVLDRDHVRTSKALWIPVVWLLISESRPVSSWLQMDATFQGPDQYLDGSPVDRLAFACLILAGLIVIFIRARQAGNFLRANIPILIFFAYCAVSTIWSDFPDVAFKRWTKAIGDLVMVMIVVTDADPIVALKRVMARTGFILLPLSILFIKYYPNLGRGYDQWAWTPVLVGVTTNKNTLGLTVLVCGLGAAWRFFQELGNGDKQDRRRHLMAQGILLLMAILLLVQAHSATSLACFVLASALLAVTSLLKMGRKLAVVNLMALGAVALPVFALFADVGAGAVQALGRDSTLTGRTAIWNVVLGMAKNPVIGTGFESFWLGERLKKLWTFYWTPLNEAHNGYIELYLNLGWIGVALLILLFITGYRNSLIAFRRDRGVGGLRIAFIVVAAVYSLTEAGFRMLSPAWILFLLAISAVPQSVPEETLPPLRAYSTDRAGECEPANVANTFSRSPVSGGSKQTAKTDPGQLKPVLRFPVAHNSERG